MNLAQEKAKHIRLLVLDVDGVLTSGMLYYTNNRESQVKGFHIHDGLGIKLLQKTGITVAIISGKSSAALSLRLEDLQIQHAYLDQEDKVPAYEDLKKKCQVQDHEIAYMGDDLPDLPLLRRAGLAITVPQAPAIVRQHVDLVTVRKAGKGAVREVCEFIMEAQAQYESVVQFYLVK